jgi:DNA polymerase-3 subunit gamma/tau
MSYQVLARKLRPQTFEAVIGQDPVTRTLRNALASGRVAHAYCFAGPRGVGKTTTARLLAKALLCAARTGPDPCGVCPPCQEVQAGTAVDVIEIDGASNRGIDEIRTLRENVKYAPARGRYKVYIIDEVHMLTEQAFNALLKTLEEPPAHVVFILATTEPQRIPLTILSRCQRFDFKPIPPPLLLESLKRILGVEGIPFDPVALPLLVRSAEGSLRDALSLLDTALAYGEGRLDGLALAHLLGAGSPAQLCAFVDALLAMDARAALALIAEAAREGQELGWFLREVVEALHQLLVIRVAPEGGLPELPPAELEELRARAARVSVDELLFVLRVFLEAEGEVRRSPHPRVEVEMATVRAIRRPVPTALETLIERVEETEARLRQMGLPGAAPAKPLAVQESLLDPAPGTAPPTLSVPGPLTTALTAAPAPEQTAASPGPDADFETSWRQVVDEVTQRKAMLGAVLEQSRPLSLKDGELLVSLAGNHFHADLLADRGNRELVNQAVQRHIPGAKRVGISISPTGPQGIEQDPAVQTALEVFEGEVVAVRPRSQEGGERR